MNGNLALDTNAVIAYRAGVAQAVAPIEEAERVFLPLVVLGELLYGADISARPDENRQAVRAVEDGCVLLEPDKETAALYASIRGEARA